jgi:predicted RNA-binding Zn ribbon-like protein
MEASSFEFSGGALCLDFANTIADRRSGRGERLHGYADVVSWGEQARLLSRRGAAQTRAAARAAPRDAGRAFARALALRERLFRIFAAVAAGRTPRRADLQTFNRALGDAMARVTVEARDGTFAWGWAAGTTPVERVLGAVVRSAADLLVSPRLADLRECASETCTWLFLDASPTRRRRWCSMKTCGNRAKARRFYQRRRAV